MEVKEKWRGSAGSRNREKERGEADWVKREEREEGGRKEDSGGGKWGRERKA